MTDSHSVSRTILQFASRDAMSSLTAQMLSRLGYSIVSMNDVDDEALELEHRSAADLLLVDERQLMEVQSDPDDRFARLPIVLLSGRQGATGADPRIVGAIKRPAGLHDLFKLLQQLFEDIPRSTPRAATQLRAKCAAKSEAWDGRVVSLSENGCLLRSAEPILLGQRITLELMLPKKESIVLEAEASYQLLPDTGFVFSAVDPAQREQLSHFVAQTLLSA